jgi:hypothetical protein
VSSIAILGISGDFVELYYNNKMALKLPFYNWQVVKDSQMLVTSTQYTVTLNGLWGPVMGLFFTL